MAHGEPSVSEEGTIGLIGPSDHRTIGLAKKRIENLRDTMREWAPYHFLLMLEALRDFRRKNCVLPVGAQQIEGSLMAHATRKSCSRRPRAACAHGSRPTTPTFRCARRTPVRSSMRSSVRMQRQARRVDQRSFSHLSGQNKNTAV
jgi:hypothetical protein